eukprot:6202162-Pleurochrysis_carterae.AAC.10
MRSGVELVVLKSIVMLQERGGFKGCRGRNSEVLGQQQRTGILRGCVQNEAESNAKTMKTLAKKWRQGVKKKKVDEQSSEGSTIREGGVRTRALEEGSASNDLDRGSGRKRNRGKPQVQAFSKCN